MGKIENKRILFTIQDYYQYQAYVQSGALREILDRVYFIVDPNFADLDFGVSKDRVIPYSYPYRKDVLHRHVFNIHSWMLRYTNRGFWIRTLYFKPRQKFYYRILSLPLIYWAARFYFLKKAQDKKLEEILSKIDPGIVVLPSHMFEGLTYEIIRFAQDKQIPSLMVVDNWDTVVYRTSFTYLPDYLGVWSEQQVKQAVSVKKMPEDKIFILGTPKFTKYLKPSQPLPPSLYPFRYVLHIGVFDEFNELEALKLADDAIEKYKLPIKVVYRPTATQFPRKCSDVFFEYDYKHVILDRDARAYYKKGVSWDYSKNKFSTKQFPDPNYNFSLLANAEFIIGGLSTMTLEALLLNKMVYVYAYDDGIHQFGPKWTIEATDHFVGLDRHKNIRIVREKSDVEKIFMPGDKLKIASDRPMDDIDYFVALQKTANYPSTIKNTIDQILAR